MKTGKTSWRVRLAATGGGIALGLGEGIERAEKMTNQTNKSERDIMKKYIHIQKKDREFIAEALGISERSVFNAIHFDARRGGTDLARRVR